MRCKILQWSLILSFVLSLRDFLESSPNYQRNFAYESRYFPNQTDHCNKFFKSIQFDHNSGVYNILHHWLGLFGSYNQFFYLKSNNKRIISKYRAHTFNVAKHIRLPLQEATLSPIFLKQSPQNGFQFCPPEKVQRFVDKLSYINDGNKTLTWLQMLANIELPLLPYLETHGFPVPKTYAICGFTIFQQFAGSTLNNFYGAPFHVKAHIAKQLLETAWRFTYGFDDFRIYITDLTADNLVYNELEQQLYFIDFNTVTIVDATSTKSDDYHMHQYIECDNCFAFSGEKLCEHNLSDLNLFEGCSFLRENLKQERHGGFLYPIPEEISDAYPQLLTLLDECISGMDASGGTNEKTNRFVAVLNLINLFKDIIKFFK